MKDYSDNSKDRKDFILSYSVNKELKEIYVQYADDSIAKIEYNEKNEKDILKKMKQQINKAYKEYEEYENEYEKMNMAFLIALMFLLLSSPLVFIAPIYYVIPFFFTGVASITKVRAFDIKKTKEDLRKNYLFLKNEYAINNKEMCERAFKYCLKTDLKDKILDKRVKFTINDSEVFTFEEMEFLNYIFQGHREYENDKYNKGCKKTKRKIK